MEVAPARIVRARPRGRRLAAETRPRPAVSRPSPAATPSDNAMTITVETVAAEQFRAAYSIARHAKTRLHVMKQHAAL